MHPYVVPNRLSSVEQYGFSSMLGCRKKKTHWLLLYGPKKRDIFQNILFCVSQKPYLIINFQLCLC